MKILYLKEHSGCDHYDAKQSTVFSHYQMTRGEELTINGKRGYLFIFLLSGKLDISAPSGEVQRVESGTIVSLGSNHNAQLKSLTKSEVLFLMFDRPIIQCDHFFIAELRSYIKPEEHNAPYRTLPVRKPIASFAKTIISYLDSKLLCAHILDLKLSEWFFLMRSFYTKEENAAFFISLKADKNRFVEQINEKSKNIFTVKALADACNMTEKTLTRNFKKYYSTTPKKWLMSSMKNEILLELLNSRDKISVIGERFGFSSDTHFSSYCKKYLNATPREIRGRND